MLKTPISFAFVAICCLACGVVASAQSAPNQSQSAKPRGVQPQVKKAQWTEQTLTYLGISKNDFVSMGLEKLTMDEYGKLLAWATNREREAANTASEAAKKDAMASQVTFFCGPKQTTDESLKKVHVFIEDNNATVAELMSGVRQRLRGISDVEIVYEPSQADLDVSILGYEDKMETGTRAIGYTASTEVTTPCVGKIGTYEWNFQMSSDHFIFSGGTDSGILVEKIVAKIDSSDIEPVRKSHAQLKSIQNKKN